MSNANATQFARIDVDPENKSPAEAADDILKSIRRGLVKTAIGNAEDDPMASLEAAAIAIEVDSRIEDSTRFDLPPHLDPTDALEDDVIEETADDILQEYADDLYYSVDRLSGDDREHFLEIIGELDSRIGGGARC